MVLLNTKYLMALDAGTGSIRAVIFSVEGIQIGESQLEWTHYEDARWPGSMNFDWEHNWKLVCRCTKDVLKKTSINPNDIAAVSTTCMREGILLYDKEGHEIWACANVDARSNNEVDELIKMDSNLEREIYSKSGQTFALCALPRLLWVKNNMPDIYSKIAHIGMFNDWLIYKLTGIEAVEPSNGSTTGLTTRTWDPAITKKCGLRSDIFPNVLEPGTIIGGINKKGSTESGLAVGTKVVVGGGDCQLAMIGINACEPGKAGVFGGSFWQYEFNTDMPKTDIDCRVRVNCHAIPGIWQLEALAFKPGLVMRWYRDAFCEAECEEAKKNHKSTYSIMDARASKIPAGSYGLLCCFSDIMNYIHWFHASPTFTNFGLDSDKYNKDTFYRAILENTAMLVKGHISLVKETTGNEPEELVFAGGAAKSPLWAQILADVTGKVVKVPVVKEATALGAAVLAGYGVGIYSSISKGAEHVVKLEHIYKPVKENHTLYEDLYRKWRKVYQAQLVLAENEITNSMWKAPGL